MTAARIPSLVRYFWNSAERHPVFASTSEDFIGRMIREATAKIKGQSLPKSDEPEQTDFAELKGTATVENGLNMWVVSDNLRKGAALNSVQIAEALADEYL